MEIIRQNLGLKVLAVALAIVGWAYLRLAANPILETAPLDQQLSVPIAAANLPLGYVARFTDREAVVTVSAKRGAPGVKPDQIKAVLDLANKGPGIYNVPVQLVAPDVAVQSLSPASVTLTIERVEQRIFPIVVHYTGAPPRGVVVNGIRVRPATATVRAPTSALAQVSAVRVDVAAPAGPRIVDEMVRPVPVGASGAELRDLIVSPDLVRVQLVASSGT